MEKNVETSPSPDAALILSFRTHCSRAVRGTAQLVDNALFAHVSDEDARRNTLPADKTGTRIGSPVLHISEARRDWVDTGARRRV